MKGARTEKKDEKGGDGAKFSRGLGNRRDWVGILQESGSEGRVGEGIGCRISEKTRMAERSRTGGHCVSSGLEGVSGTMGKELGFR